MSDFFKKMKVGLIWLNDFLLFFVQPCQFYSWVFRNSVAEKLNAIWKNKLFPKHLDYRYTVMLSAFSFYMFCLSMWLYSNRKRKWDLHNVRFSPWSIGFFSPYVQAQNLFVVRQTIDCLNDQGDVFRNIIFMFSFICSYAQ